MKFEKRKRKNMVSNIGKKERENIEDNFYQNYFASKITKQKILLKKFIVNEIWELAL